MTNNDFRIDSSSTSSHVRAATARTSQFMNDARLKTWWRLRIRVSMRAESRWSLLDWCWHDLNKGSWTRFFCWSPGHDWPLGSSSFLLRSTFQTTERVAVSIGPLKEKDSLPCEIFPVPKAYRQASIGKYFLSCWRCLRRHGKFNICRLENSQSVTETDMV